MRLVGLLMVLVAGAAGWSQMAWREVASWGIFGEGANQFSNPQSMQIAPDNLLYFVNNFGVSVWDTNGVYLRSWAMPTVPNATTTAINIVISSAGEIIVVASRVTRIDGERDQYSFHFFVYSPLGVLLRTGIVRDVGLYTPYYQSVAILNDKIYILKTFGDVDVYNLALVRINSLYGAGSGTGSGGLGISTTTNKVYAFNRTPGLFRSRVYEINPTTNTVTEKYTTYGYYSMLSNKVGGQLFCAFNDGVRTDTLFTVDYDGDPQSVLIQNYALGPIVDAVEYQGKIYILTGNSVTRKAVHVFAEVPVAIVAPIDKVLNLQHCLMLDNGTLTYRRKMAGDNEWTHEIVVATGDINGPDLTILSTREMEAWWETGAGDEVQYKTTDGALTWQVVT